VHNSDRRFADLCALGGAFKSALCTEEGVMHAALAEQTPTMDVRLLLLVAGDARHCVAPAAALCELACFLQELAAGWAGSLRVAKPFQVQL